jgi:enamine deaminase RidA (YjgF/YER057c/UK114 family)
VRIGDVVYLAGQVAWDKDGNIVGSDLLTQSRQIFKNIAEVLNLAGASLTDIVRLTQYFTDMRDIRPYRQARREAMPGVACITTGIQVARMTHPDLLLEVEAMAVV